MGNSKDLTSALLGAKIPKTNRFLFDGVKTLKFENKAI